MPVFFPPPTTSVYLESQIDSILDLLKFTNPLQLNTQSHHILKGGRPGPPKTKEFGVTGKPASDHGPSLAQGSPCPAQVQPSRAFSGCVLWGSPRYSGPILPLQSTCHVLGPPTHPARKTPVELDQRNARHTYLTTESLLLFPHTPKNVLVAKGFPAAASIRFLCFYSLFR